MERTINIKITMDRIKNLPQTPVAVEHVKNFGFNSQSWCNFLSVYQLVEFIPNLDYGTQLILMLIYENLNMLLTPSNFGGPNFNMSQLCV